LKTGTQYEKNILFIVLVSSIILSASCTQKESSSEQSKQVTEQKAEEQKAQEDKVHKIFSDTSAITKPSGRSY
jgi:hypothetical protein